MTWASESLPCSFSLSPYHARAQGQNLLLVASLVVADNMWPTDTDAAWSVTPYACLYVGYIGHPYKNS